MIFTTAMLMEELQNYRYPANKIARMVAQGEIYPVVRGLYVGDSDVDLKTAQNAKLDCVSCSWGFKTKAELISYGAKIIIDKPMELLNHL